ncbi:hypothetical protein Tdes44962_MAKER01581 [Teratosphaeria destructans]|uniref:Uncharacterized protein n=1 Tax=Teratosphaeria destructans TaxID=418781 RepID=A0A9W7SYW7_9PEZI|nr:hypothetical protein Tdes44962_MAKER01581 [Teratosphaeria destructans]
MGKGWGFKRVSSGSLGGSSWSGSRPIENGEIANHPATNHPFWRQQFQNYQDRIKYPYHNARPSSSRPADNNPADPKFSPSRSLRELIKERMDEQRKCLKWMDEYFLTPLSDMASSAILDLDDEKQAKKLKKGLGDKQIDGETVAHIQRDAQAAAAYGGMPMMGMGMGEVSNANAPLEVRKVADKAERWRDPMGWCLPSR